MARIIKQAVRLRFNVLSIDYVRVINCFYDYDYEAATICPRPAPCKLTFDLLTLKVVSESGVTWATSVPILLFLGLSDLELSPMYATDRQTSDRQTDRQTSNTHHRLMPRLYGGGGISICAEGRHNMPRRAPCKLTFDLLTLKVVSESHVTWPTSVSILVFLGVSVLDLGPLYATDRRQTRIIA